MIGLDNGLEIKKKMFQINGSKSRFSCVIEQILVPQGSSPNDYTRKLF